LYEGQGPWGARASGRCAAGYQGHRGRRASTAWGLGPADRRTGRVARRGEGGRGVWGEGEGGCDFTVKKTKNEKKKQ
jgi:hypothetical protein